MVAISLLLLYASFFLSLFSLPCKSCYGLFYLYFTYTRSSALLVSFLFTPLYRSSSDLHYHQYWLHLSPLPLLVTKDDHHSICNSISILSNAILFLYYLTKTTKRLSLSISYHFIHSICQGYLGGFRIVYVQLLTQST